jgi:hypothetical protein
MIVSHPQRVTWTYLVFQEEEPRTGEYVDSRGFHWHVRHVIREPRVVMREPAPPAWYVEMGADHASHRLEPGDELRQLFGASEVATRREQLTTLLRGDPQFDCVGVSEDGFTLLAHFREGLPTYYVPNEVDGMPVEARTLR